MKSILPPAKKRASAATLSKLLQLEVLLLVWGSFPLLAQSPQALPKPDGKIKEMPKDIEERINLILNWGERISTPGTKAQLIERTRTRQNDGKSLIGYEVYVTGLPDDQSYALYQFPITMTEPMLAASPVFLATGGKLCLTKVKDCPTSVQVGVVPARGEPFRFMLVSKSGNAKVATTIVPDPIVSVDHRCELEAIRLTPKFDIALIRGKGFRPGDTLSYTSNSQGEILQGSITASDAGDFATAFLPSVPGLTDGTQTVTIRGDSCSPSVSLKWGSLD